jgi:ATP-dependent DNA ligase
MLKSVAARISADLLAIKSTSGLNAKQELASSWVSGDHKYFIDLVHNNKRQWFATWAGVLKAEPSGEDLDLDEILYQAEKRIATPAQTCSRIRQLLVSGWPENVLKAIIEKTLDAGLTASSVKKATGDARVFGPALASDWLKMNDKKRQALLEEHDYYSTVKIDGIRCLCKLHTPDQGAYSRGLKPLPKLDKHVAALAKMIPFPCIVDGEMVAADGTWNTTITGAKKAGTEVPMYYYIFDLVLAEEAASQKYTMPARERWALIEQHIDFGDESMFRQVHHNKVDTIEEVNEQLEEALSDGWEGLVIADGDAPYACKRSTAWVKIKVFQSAEFTITGFIKGTGKHTGRLGAITVKGMFGAREVITEVGSGFSDAEREEIWKNQKQWLGRTVEVKFFESTKDGSLRFPTFLRHRDDLDV